MLRKHDWQTIACGTVLLLGILLIKGSNDINWLWLILPGILGVICILAGLFDD